MASSRPNELMFGHVLKPATVKMLQGQPLRMQQIADRWASGSPAKVKALEANGQLLDRLKERAALENQTLADAKAGGAMNDTPDSEILALNGVDSLPA